MIKDDVDTDAKSLLAVLGACIQYGDEVEFICEGEDEGGPGGHASSGQRKYKTYRRYYH